MRQPFCIFKLQGDGDLHFVEAMQTFDDAKARVREIDELWPGEYGIENVERGSGYSLVQGTRRRISESVLRVEQGFNATEELSHAITLWHDCRYAENLGERFAKKLFKHGEDHDWRVRHRDLKPCCNFYTVRNRHAKVQNHQIRLAGIRFLNCFVAVSGFTNLKLGMALNEGPDGVFYRDLVLGNKNALRHR